MAKQAYSIDEDKMVDVAEAPAAEKVVDKVKEEEEESEDESEEEEVEEVEDKSETESDDTEESEEEESEEESEEEETEEKKDEEEESSEEEVSVDEFIKDKFSEKYGIESEEQFMEILDKSVEVMDENEVLKKKVDELEKAPKEPVFKSENQKAVFNLLKDFDPDKLPDGLHMVAGLINMDPEKTDAKLVLEQEFIMQHPELTLDQARKKFQRRYESKYIIKEEDFESIDQYNDKKDDIETDLQIDKAKAVKFIQSKQTEFKAKSEEKPEVKNEVPEEVQTGIAGNVKAFEAHVDGLDSLIFEVEEDSKNQFTYKFTKEQLTKIKSVALSHLKNPRVYNEKGKLVEGLDSEGTFQRAAFALYGQEITEEALKSAAKYAHIIKADDIAKRVPKRVAKAKGESQELSIDAQADRIAAKKKAERLAARK